MMNRRVAILAARELLTWLGMIGLFFAGWWMPTFGEQSGIGDIDTARRVVGILTGIGFIALGNRVPKGMLLPPSHDGAAAVQQFQRHLGWACVLTGVVFVLFWLVLPVGWASYLANFSGGLLFFSAMFLVWRRVRHLNGNQQAC